MKLYSYFRSSAAYRVRIALNLKDIDYRLHLVHMLRSGGEHLQPAYRAVNPLGLVPALELGDSTVLTQSLAICEYIEETYPEPPLLPRHAVDRAYVRSLAQLIACDIHPLNNLRALKRLVDVIGATEEKKAAWYHHWVTEGLAALEAELAFVDKG
ncbi:maleylacetoacetate isomerase [Chelatococcus sp. HY11]|uniref:maleylacetoacetate isomerase n=1 Tax=Chelatococcus sp. HY11 TaxID=2835634 RepID=UPI001BCF2061|nr:maleylacetoacetate isomerase [Chelatococcus sp. HY11]MBS7743496.1 maleylacetoacetate isomerase [Chelatococcus sp. HY11]MBX3321329.1 maleylacetoacetate isomerase [Nitrospira sp.]CAH1662435.1 putative Glutathione transferase [Hyphomicrobiales bacterium]CAH1687619.1 putative Glutathione transferase [Hyphomicrobiales bacterium]